jgi:hypothetical protein
MMWANPGDKIDPSATIEEKAQQVAVDAPDITGDHIKVPPTLWLMNLKGNKRRYTTLKMRKRFLM